MSETRERMSRLIEGWKSSGQSATLFAAEHGVTRAKFEYWKGRLKGPGENRKALSAPSFVPVQVIGTGAGPLEVVLSSGDRLLIHDGCSVEILREVLRALRGGC
jgi:hypothetical protein